MQDAQGQVPCGCKPSPLRGKTAQVTSETYRLPFLETPGWGDAAMSKLCAQSQTNQLPLVSAVPQEEPCKG